MPKINSSILTAMLCGFIGLSANIALAETTSSKPNMTTAAYENWVLRCVNIEGLAEGSKTNSTEHCEVVHSIQLQGQPQAVAQIALGRLPGDSELTLTVVLPNNAAFSSDITITATADASAEKKEIATLKWKRCLPQGCFADSKFNPKTLTSLQDVAEGSIRFVDGMDRPVELPVSWRGLTAAFAALK